MNRKFLLSALLLAVVLLGTGSIHFRNSLTRSVVLQTRIWPVIVIDPGHGGIDGGAVSPEGILEKDLNLEISLKLADQLKLMGLEVIMTRDSDVMYGSKTEDTRGRADTACSAGRNVIFVSIHQNKFSQVSSHGTQTFYGLSNPASKLLAELIQKRVVEKLQPDNHRLCQAGSSNIYLMKNLKCTAVLVECGFLSNPNDLTMLTDAEYQSKLAFVLAGSLLEFVNQTEV